PEGLRSPGHADGVALDRVEPRIADPAQLVVEMIVQFNRGETSFFGEALQEGLAEDSVSGAILHDKAMRVTELSGDRAHHVSGADSERSNLVVVPDRDRGEPEGVHVYVC